MKPKILQTKDRGVSKHISSRQVVSAYTQLTPQNNYAYETAIIDALHEPILILDYELTIQSANDAFYKSFKITPKEALHHSLFDVKPKSDQMQMLIQRLEKLSKSNTTFKEFEITQYFKNLGERTLRINAKKLVFANRMTNFILLGIEDITQRKSVERQKDDFVGYITHELRTPITSISAFIQLLQRYHEKTGDKKSQFLLAKTAGQLERLNKLLNSFTYVYKAQNGMLALQKEKIDLYEVIKETVETFQYTTTTHTISIDGNIAKPIIADKERIRQVVINLLINAIKYSPYAETIMLKFREEQKNVIVSVEDFGPGIPKESQTRIFERFFRVKRGNQGYSVKGLGLGLYIALEIIKAHKGKLWVESTEGKGSTFSFSLPVKPQREKRVLIGTKNKNMSLSKERNASKQRKKKTVISNLLKRAGMRHQSNAAADEEGNSLIDNSIGELLIGSKTSFEF